MKGFLIGLAGLTVIGLSGSALANLTSDSVNVQIDVQPTMSVWSEDENITLVMDGSDPGGSNLALANSALNVVSNIRARVNVKVDGQLPPPEAGNRGLRFFLFHGTEAEVVRARLTADPYLEWHYPAWEYSSLGTTLLIVPRTRLISERFPLIYAVTSPDGIPLPGEWNLTVLYTISPYD